MVLDLVPGSKSLPMSIYPQFGDGTDRLWFNDLISVMALMHVG